MVIRLYYYFVIRPKSVTLNVFYVSLNKTDLFTEFFKTFVKIDIKYPLNVKSFFSSYWLSLAILNLKFTFAKSRKL